MNLNDFCNAIKKILDKISCQRHLNASRLHNSLLVVLSTLTAAIIFQKHCDITLFAMKSSNKLKYLKLEKKEMNNSKRSCYTVLKGHYDKKIVWLLLISVRHHFNIHLQDAFSFIISCLVVEVFIFQRQ